MRKIKNTRIGDKKERYKAMALAISIQPNILFDVVDPAEFTAEHTNFINLDSEYSQDLLESQKHNNLRYNADDRLKKRTSKILSYLKVKYHAEPKRVGDWGANQIYAVNGIVAIPTTNVAKEELYANILAKHLADDVDSILSRFDMLAYAADLQELTDEKANFKAKLSSWKSKNMYRKASMGKLDKMMSHIARDLLSREDILYKDLVLWGFAIADVSNTNNEDNDELPIAS